MKTKTTLFKKISLFAAVVALATTFSSCSKDDDVEEGKSVNLKVVNAAEASGSQDFYVEGVKVTTVAEAGDQGYITSGNSGSNRKLEFKKSGSSEVYASQSADLKDGKNYTVILSGTGNSAKVTVADDGDLAAPSSGKAKVRFVHLSTAANSNVDLGVSGDNKLVSGLAYGQVTNYVEVDGGLTMLNAYNAGTTSNPVSINFANLAAGKIYTVILRGSTNVSTQVVVNK